MANIEISDLRAIDDNLSLDSKTFFNDLTEQETANILGGLHIHFTIWHTVICITIPDLV